MTRRSGDKIYLVASNGERVEVSFDRIEGGEAKLSIKAPPGVAIHRDAAYVEMKLAASIKKGP
mgnify:CR=1 FL=1